jgi:hypothetical protein
MPEKASSLLAAILLGGLIAGTVDVGAAALINWVNIPRILQVIAAGALGREASFQGGARSAVLGLGLQWAMSLIIAAIFVLAARALPGLRHGWALAGLAYGAVVFAVMNYVVVPLSAIGRIPRFTSLTLLENLLAMLLFGVIIAFCARERTPVTS